MIKDDNQIPRSTVAETIKIIESRQWTNTCNEWCEEVIGAVAKAGCFKKIFENWPQLKAQRLKRYCTHPHCSYDTLKIEQ